LVIAGSVLAHLVQTSGGTRVLDVRFAGTGGVSMSGLLFIPSNATSATPAPGILAVHGYFNSRETQGDFAIEFARRGYVVLALDQTGHGYSDPPAFAGAFGGPDGLRYLRSLDFVDGDNIGMEGHSMGGWAVVNAAAADPDGYRAVVLEGSSTGVPFAPEGTTEFPRNLAVVFAQFDEFSQVMWGVPSARQVTESEKLQRVFGTEGPVEPERVYGSIQDGTARVLYTPGGTHPWNHLSKAAIGSAAEWFQRTLRGGIERPPDDQVWQWKELGTATAFIGFVVLLLGIVDRLLRLPSLATLVETPAATVSREGRWWAALLTGALLPAVTIYPFFELGSRILPASALLPQGFTNEILIWAVLNALLVWVLGRLFGGVGPQRRVQWSRALVLALLTFAAGYAVVVIVNAALHTDLRYWFFALKPMSTRQFGAFLVYVIPFSLFFIVVLRGLHALLTVRGDSALKQYLTSVVALGGGFAVLLLAQYGWLFTEGRLIEFFMNDTLRTVIAINFVPLMAIVGVVSTFVFRRTASHLPGALLCAGIVAWYVVVGQATQAG
jgi:pimeloyl-ACP methyl ester carboxylesterase